MSETTTALVAAAAVMAGDPEDYTDERDWRGAVAWWAAEIAKLAEDERVTRPAAVVAGAHDKTDTTSKCFAGTLVDLTKEERSKRYILHLYTGTDRNEEGVETLRTEPFYTPLGRRQIRALRDGMVGHRLLVYVDMQPMDNGQKVRVLASFTDLGTPRED